MHTGYPVNLGDLIGPQTPTDKTALIAIDEAGAAETFTYGDLDALSADFAAALQSSDLPVGGSIALLGINSAWYAVAYLGIMRAGMVAVPVSYRQTPEMVQHCLSDSRVGLILVDDLARDVAYDAPKVRLHRGMAEDLPGVKAERTFTPVANGPRDAAMVLYTSGSTGKPKGVELSHESQIFALSLLGPQRARISTEIMSIAAPLYHMNGLSMLKLSLMMGGTVVLFATFKAPLVIGSIPRYRISWMTGIPTMFALIAERKDLLETTDLSSVRRINMASSPLTDNLVELLERFFPQALVLNGYGTTEHGPVSFVPHPDGIATPPLSIGVPAPGVETRLVGRGQDDYGILEVRSPANMNCYRNLPEKTAERLKDNWYHTGDVFRADANGFHFFIGREDDMFVCNGENVHPGDVELVLERHPAIRQACVVPVNDPIRGDTPVAFVTGDNSVSESEIQEYYRNNAPPVQYPRRVVFVDELPLAGTNKVDRHKVKAWAKDIAIAKKS